MSKVVYLNDEELLTALRSGSEQALGAVYKNYFPMILHFITQNSGTEQEAKDVYQEAMIVLYEHLKDGDFALSCKIKTYIYSVCRRLWLKKLAQKSRFVGKIEDFETFIPFARDEGESEERDDQFKAMQESMADLGEPCRTILEDFFIRGYSMQQITDKMGYTNADNAKNQKYKCLLRLKKIFFTRYKAI